MTQENLNPSEVMKSHTTQRLLTGAKEHMDMFDRPDDEIGELIWTVYEGNSIADLCNLKNVN